MSYTADQWNQRFPKGTRVIAYPGITPEYADQLGITDFPRIATTTRSRAWNLGHGEPVVLVEYTSGGIGLDHLVTDPDLGEWRRMLLAGARERVTRDEDAVLETHKAHQAALDRLTLSLEHLEEVAVELEKSNG